tara:strand:+ start:429 stop:878 length:450 start_codon:yes stop_codon:yes gene_type:complete
MKKNYFEPILGFITLIIAISFFNKFVSVNTADSNSSTYNLKARFLKAGGIMIGNDVKMRGVKIGVVSDVKLDKEYFALIEFQIYSKIKIPKESNVKIASDGILGNKYLSITPQGDNLNDFIQKSGEVKDVEDYESIEDQVSKIIFLATQ